MSNGLLTQGAQIPLASVEPPTAGEWTPAALAGSLRSIVAALSGILITLGVVSPKTMEKMLGYDWTVAASMLLLVSAQAHNWWSKYHSAHQTNQVIVKALQTAPVNADGLSVTPADIKQAVHTELK